MLSSLRYSCSTACGRGLHSRASLVTQRSSMSALSPSPLSSTSIHHHRLHFNLHPSSRPPSLFSRLSRRFPVNLFSSSTSSSASSSSSSSPSPLSPFESYVSAHHLSLSDPDLFWREAAKSVHWSSSFKGPVYSVNADTGNYTWFPNETVNTCENALDIHVQQGRGNQTAIVYDSPVTGTRRMISYSELLSVVSKLAGALSASGVTKGDRAIIYMPMIPQSAMAMLACARLGVVHSVVFGGFAPHELAKRIQDAKPKVIITASCGIEGKKIIPYDRMVNEAIKLANHEPERVIVWQRSHQRVELNAPRDVDWVEFVKGAPDSAPVPVKATDPLYILYTSGTTGMPKGVVRDNGGHLVALKYMISKFEGVKPGDTFWAGSDIGWVVGHTFIVYAPLFMGCTTVMYEGKPVGTPDASAFWRVISENKVNVFYTSPSAIRAVKKEDPELKLKEKYDTSSLRRLFLAGERADSDSLAWAGKKLNVPVIDNWWQTETGWPIAGNPCGYTHPPFFIKPGSTCVPLPGYDLRCVDQKGQELPHGEHGNLVVKLPLPPGTLPTLWQNPQRFQASYFKKYPGYYDTADAGFIDEDGYAWVLSRTDDILNVAGHRLSGGAIEEVICSMSAVAEVAVIGVPDDMKGEVPLAVCIIKSGITVDESKLEADVIAAVRHSVGAVASLKRVIIANRLPKTRSGKVLRNIMRSIAKDESYTVPPTIEDIAVVDEIKDLFIKKNLVRKPLQ